MYLCVDLRTMFFFSFNLNHFIIENGNFHKLAWRCWNGKMESGIPERSSLLIKCAHQTYWQTYRKHWIPDLWFNGIIRGHFHLNYILGEFAFMQVGLGAFVGESECKLQPFLILNCSLNTITGRYANQFKMQIFYGFETM